MKMKVVTMTIPKDVHNKAKKASKEMFGQENFSGYVQSLINRDCKERGIKEK